MTSAERSPPGEHFAPGSGVSRGRSEESEHTAGMPSDRDRSSPALIDTHCHLDMLADWGRQDDPPGLDEQLAEADAALARAKAAGITLVINPGTQWDEFDRVRTVGDRHPEVFLAFGIHPHEASTWDEGAYERLKAYGAGSKVVAIGECGLDYHYNASPADAQRRAFREQIRLAQELAKPLIVHTREADDDTLTILRAEHAEQTGGVLHCFTSSQDLAEAALALGFYISFSGALTFAKAENVREVARRVPLDRLLVETDAPFLAPPPHRGKRNEPAFVIRVAEQLAALHGLSLEELGRQTTDNARRLFRLPA